MTRALITGITGQDGFYLATHLRELGVEVWGAGRDGQLPPDLGWVCPTAAIEVCDPASVERAVAESVPDQVYHLAGWTSVASSWAAPVKVGEVTGLGTARLLEAVRRHAATARVFVASSSEVFGEPERAPQDETTPIQPVSPYGAAKAYAHHLARLYRRRHGLYVAVGILYNHESPRRPPEFVTRKIVQGAVAIARGETSELRLGNLEAQRDWGAASDYVQAMRKALEPTEPEEYAIATGEIHTVRDWCELAFARIGLDYRDFVREDPAFWRPTELVPLVGDATKAWVELGWRAATPFPDLVTGMLDAELR